MLPRGFPRRYLRKPAAWLRHWKHRLRSTTEMRIYRSQFAEAEEAASETTIVQKDDWANLELFDEQSGWVTRDVFLAEACSRLSAGEHVYTIVTNGQLAHHGWAVAPTRQRYVLEVDQYVDLPADAAYLYDFFTHPDFRSQGLYQRVLRHILLELKQEPIAPPMKVDI